MRKAAAYIVLMLVMFSLAGVFLTMQSVWALPVGLVILVGTATFVYYRLR